MQNRRRSNSDAAILALQKYFDEQQAAAPGDTSENLLKRLSAIYTEDKYSIKAITTLTPNQQKILDCQLCPFCFKDFSSHAPLSPVKGLGKKEEEIHFYLIKCLHLSHCVHILPFRCCLAHPAKPTARHSDKWFTIEGTNVAGSNNLRRGFELLNDPPTFELKFCHLFNNAVLFETRMETVYFKKKHENKQVWICESKELVEINLIFGQMEMKFENGEDNFELKYVFNMFRVLGNNDSVKLYYNEELKNGKYSHIKIKVFVNKIKERLVNMS